MAELRQIKTTPITLDRDSTIRSFQQTIQDIFRGEDRIITKRYLKLLLARGVINLPRVNIIGRTEKMLAILKNQKAVRT